MEVFPTHFKLKYYNLTKHKTSRNYFQILIPNIHLFTLQRFKNRNNGLAPLEMRNKAVA